MRATGCKGIKVRLLLEQKKVLHTTHTTMHLPLYTYLSEQGESFVNVVALRKAGWGSFEKRWLGKEEE